MATYTVDQIMACLDQLDLEPVFITSKESKRTVQARVAYAIEGNGKGKLKGLVVLVPDVEQPNPSVELATTLKGKTQ